MTEDKPVEREGIPELGIEKHILYCSFCGRSQKEVKRLIAGPTVFICDQCVELCRQICADEEITVSDTSKIYERRQLFNEVEIKMNELKSLYAKLHRLSEES